jgi:hypothetical protein
MLWGESVIDMKIVFESFGCLGRGNCLQTFEQPQAFEFMVLNEEAFDDFEI